MSIFLWIIFGALAGWIASILMGRNHRMGLLSNIVVGILGSALGGWLSSVLFVAAYPASWRSLLVAVGGSCLLLFLFRGIGREKGKPFSNAFAQGLNRATTKTDLFTEVGFFNSSCG